MNRSEGQAETRERQELERLMEESRLHAAEMDSLYQMALALAAAVNLDEMLNDVLKQVRHVLACDVAFVSLATAGGQALRIEAVDGRGADELQGIEFPVDRGINAWIYREGKPVLIADADTDPRRLHIKGRTEEVRAAVGAPLMADGATFGTIYAACSQPNCFSKAHLDFLTITASQVAAAVQRARLLDRARRRAEEMETLYNIGAVMAASLDVGHVLQTIYEQAGRIMDTSAFFVALYEPASDELRFELVYERGERIEPFAVRLSGSKGLTAYVVRSAEPLLIHNWELERSNLPIEPLMVGEPTVSWLGVPIIVQDRVLGAIGSQSFSAHAFTNRQARLLAAMANQAGISLQKARLYEDLKLVNTDLQEMVGAQAHLLQAIEEMIPVLNLEEGPEILRRLAERERDHV
jgi:sigma-B regulation protein RsbU (phosphoserine phosphatase)